MRSNEWWIADNHTFDIITEGENGQRHRLYLTAFFDARSGIFTGCYVTNAPSSQSTLTRAAWHPEIRHPGEHLW